MKKKLALFLLPALVVLSPVVSADTCPAVTAVVWQGTHWGTADGLYYGISEYSAGKNTPPVSFENVFWTNAQSQGNGTVVCNYNTADASQDIEMMHSGWTIAEPTQTNWVSGVWRQNVGLVCGGNDCNF